MTPLAAQPPTVSHTSFAPRLLSALGLLFVFFLGVKGLGDGFRLLGEDVITTFFAATENPFIGIVVGLLATTLVQSSSVTTAMIVGLVAAPENPLPLANAVPMVMGANIGTTVTATIVSLAHIGRRDEFERAFPVAVCHDVFNYLAVLILLPLEMTTGYLRRLAGACSTFLSGVGGVEYQSPLREAISLGFSPVITLAETLFSGDGIRSLFLIAVGGFFIFFSLFLFVKVMRSAMHSRVERVLNSVLGSKAAVLIPVGVLVTVMVQSSSITTSLLVPLAGAGLLRLEQAFPITIGANIGTTVTALLAALAVSRSDAAVALALPACRRTAAPTGDERSAVAER